jgi:hypothetical protein
VLEKEIEGNKEKIEKIKMVVLIVLLYDEELLH